MTCHRNSQLLDQVNEIIGAELSDDNSGINSFFHHFCE